MLTGAQSEMSAVELDLTTGPFCSLSCTAYHARQLKEAGLATWVDGEGAAASSTYRYSSLIGDNRSVLAVLQATEKSDREHLTAATP